MISNWIGDVVAAPLVDERRARVLHEIMNAVPVVAGEKSKMRSLMPAVAQLAHRRAAR